MRQTSKYSSSVTGCTESRIEVTSDMLASLGFAFTSFRETDFGMSRTALICTQSQRASPSAVESGRDSSQTSTMPTTSSPSLE